MTLSVDIEKKLRSFHLRVKFELDDKILGLLGASGCGKSMTLKCIAGIEKPDRGKIILDGRILFDSEKKINLPPQKRHTGYLFQNYALFPNMTVRQNILCGLHHEKDKLRREKLLIDISNTLQLKDIENYYPSQISGGQAQRTALARILVNRPNILMLDEPFSALDTHLRLRLQMYLRDLLKDYGKGVILVTHDRNEAYRMCDSIAVIDGGIMFCVKGTQEFFDNPETVQAAKISGCKNIARAEKVSSHKIFVPDWNISLSTAGEVKDNISYAGIRAHYFDPMTKQNRYKVKILRTMEEPFDLIIEFRYENQNPESESLWRRVPKSISSSNFYDELGIAEENILLLREK